MVDGAPRQPDWDPPSPRVAELIRLAAQTLLDDWPAQTAALDVGVLDANRDLLQIEPRTLDAVRAATRSNFAHWATANLREPGRRVAADVSAESTGLARDAVRHGLDETISRGYRSGQNTGIRMLHQLVFDLTSNPAEQRELLEAVSQSMFAFVDDSLAAIQEVMNRERADLRDPRRADRLEVIHLIREDASIPEQRAGARLRYDLASNHVAVVVWSDTEVEQGQLEAFAIAMGAAVGIPYPLICPVGASTLWVWLSDPRGVDAAAVAAQARRLTGSADDARVAVGRAGSGIGGFRGSHLEAVEAQRLARRLGSRNPVTGYEDVEVVALATRDEEAAREFVERTLGDLLDAPADIRETLRVFLREQSSLTRTARALPAHRNTVLARLDRARDLLPRGLAGSALPVSLALEISRFVVTRQNEAS